LPEQSGPSRFQPFLEAAWFTKNQLAGEVVYPDPLMQYKWEQLKSETWQVEILPSRKAGL
jgi:hypothetical protein